MKIKQSIAFDGRNINDIFSLPCVQAVEKGENGKPYIKLYASCTDGKTDSHRRHCTGAVQQRHVANILKGSIPKGNKRIAT